MSWYLMVLKRYADFSGRSRRREYWMFVLLNFVISVGVAIIDNVIGSDVAAGVGVLGVLYALILLTPGLAVSVRRLHDTGRSGWLILIALIPIVGLIILIVWAAQDGQPDDNQYGPNPKTAAGLA